MDSSFDFQQLQKSIQALYKLRPNDPFTMKWVDDEGDPCMLTCDEELQESIRLYYANKEPFLAVHVFNGAPLGPGLPCPAEDGKTRSFILTFSSCFSLNFSLLYTVKMYRRGAKRWNKKFYHLKGHNFVGRRFNKNAICAYCEDRIWGLGQQGYKCINCKLLIHKRCAPSVDYQCGEVAPPHEVVRQRPVTVNGDTGANVTMAAKIDGIKSVSIRF
ncbi:unnamed protein product [Rodentolepis nana]|uniref:Phorbol-ester/DAG-type domain-containing protein n=1 Tax=Rodentolepis nana TaxID=102285 RepID=A0A0R3TTZ0_RODNA|nr:unnamed protein product [Rodentolepis nana]